MTDSERPALSGHMSALLAGLGVATARQLDAAHEAVDSWLALQRIDAKVASMRWDMITLEAHGIDAHRLTWERQRILDVANAAGGPRYTTVRIRARRNT